MIPSPWHKGAFSILSNAELWLNAVSQGIISWLKEQCLSSIPPLAVHPQYKMRLSHPLLLALQIPLQWTADRICELQVSVQTLGLRCASDLHTLTFRHRAGALSLTVTQTVSQGALCTPVHLWPEWNSHSEGSHWFLQQGLQCIYWSAYHHPHFLSLISGTNIEKEIKIIEEEVSHVVCYQHQLTVTPCLHFFLPYDKQMHSSSFDDHELVHFQFSSVVELSWLNTLNKREMSIQSI